MVWIIYIRRPGLQKLQEIAQRHVLIYGVTRQGRGIPSCVIQRPVTRKYYLLKTSGTVEVCVLVGDSACPNLVALSIYNSKLVCLISNACENVEQRRE